MRNLSFIFLWLFFYPALLHGQNLVSNGNFDISTSCPSYLNQLFRCPGWIQHHNGTSDYFNTCAAQSSSVSIPSNYFGSQPALNGTGYMGLLTYSQSTFNDFKEYIEAEITPTVKGVPYEVSMFVSLSEKSAFATNDLGVFFYKDFVPERNSYNLPPPPQISYSNYGSITDKNNWVRLSKMFIADSAYEHIVIGGFSRYNTMALTPVPVVGQSMNSAYYYIDSVVIKPMVLVEAEPNDFKFCRGDEFRLDYTAKHLNFFGAGNVFTLQLSDSAGNFENPVDIGSLASTTSGSILAKIPGTIATSYKYKMRIVSSDPVVSFAEFPASFFIEGTMPKPVASIAGSLCEKDSMTLSVVSETKVGKFSWTGPAITGSFDKENLVIRNIRPSYSGPYIVRAELTECVAYDTLDVNVKPLPAGYITGDSTVCEGSTLMLQVQNNINGTQNIWKTPSGSLVSGEWLSVLSASPADKGMYHVTYMHDGCSQTLPAKVDVVPPPSFDLGTGSIVCNDAELTLNVDIAGATYTWQDGSTGSMYRVLEAGRYIVTVHTAVCGDYSDSIDIEYESCSCTPIIASAFTPNNDGLNDKINVTVNCTAQAIDFKIMSRSGIIVFQTTNPRDKWDGTYKGTPLDIGTYFYALKVKTRNREFRYKGDITLIR